jgi:predicted dehydrogenase
MIQALVIGLGQIGLMYDYDANRTSPSSHTLAYLNHTDVNLAAAADLNSQRQINLLEKAPETIFYNDYKQMLTEHTADIVSICTPPKSHFEIIKYLVENTCTKLIFCEKPVIADEREAQLLMQLLTNSKCILVPNLSRRWSKGMTRIHEVIKSKELGLLQKINVRYTRGIFNTGSHIFDLINWFAGEMGKVLVVNQISTSADQEDDPSFSFHFTTIRNISGFAEAFDDRNYYMFEMDLFFEAGKIEVRESGNKVNYYHVSKHPLFFGFTSLHLDKKEDNLLQESIMQNAINHLVNIRNNEELPVCTVRDGLYPIFIAQSILKSNSSSSWEYISFNA